MESQFLNIPQKEYSLIVTRLDRGFKRTLLLKQCPAHRLALHIKDYPILRCSYLNLIFFLSYFKKVTTVKQSFRRGLALNHQVKRIWSTRKSHPITATLTESLDHSEHKEEFAMPRRQVWTAANCFAAVAATRLTRPKRASIATADSNGVARSPVRRVLLRSTSTPAAESTRRSIKFRRYSEFLR